MEERIAECAKRIFTLLEHAPEINILRVSEELGERSVIAYQALGWLARDRKIRYGAERNPDFHFAQDVRTPYRSIDFSLVWAAHL